MFSLFTWRVSQETPEFGTIILNSDLIFGTTLFSFWMILILRHIQKKRRVAVNADKNHMVVPGRS
jgi:hypothetical protein